MSEGFTDVDAKSVKTSMPLLIGITGCPGSGKTFSALELATGMRRAVGGDVYLMDTEAGRSLHYRQLYDFRYVPFKPPFSPDRYRAGIAYCLSKGAKVIIIDSMSSEHSGDGGVLDQIEQYLEEKAGDNFANREKYKWAAQIGPKRQRKELNNYIEQVGAQAILIFLFRAEDKSKPGPGGKAQHLGWVADTTSKLPYMLTARFLLLPGSDGKPVINPETDQERLGIKMPIQFRDLVKPGLQLNRDLGEKLARWSLGTDDAKPAGAPLAAHAPNPVATTPPVELASKEQVEEIQTELGRLRWSTKQIKEWLSPYGAAWVDKIPAGKAIALLQDLIARADPPQ